MKSQYDPITLLPSIQAERAEFWMNQYFPSCTKVDVNFTFEKYNFPDFVQVWIMNGGWVKESNNNGGTYRKPN